MADEPIVRDHKHVPGAGPDGPQTTNKPEPAAVCDQKHKQSVIELWKSITGNNELASLSWQDICRKIHNPDIFDANEVAWARIVQTNIMEQLKTESIKWPSLDVTLPFEQFQQKIKDLFEDLVKSFEKPDVGCGPKNQKIGCGKSDDSKDEKDSKSAKKCMNFNAIDYNMIQQLAYRMFTPDSPFKGRYLWHSVGSGKTCLGGLLGSAFQAKGWTVIWVTRTSLKAAIENSVFDRACHIGLQRAFKGQKGLSMCPKEDRFEMLQKLFAKEGGTFLPPVNYRIFCNAFSYPSNPLLAKLKAIQRKRGRPADSDLLYKTLIIIDEFHLLTSAFDAKSGLDKLPQVERPSKKEVELAFKAVENSYAKSGDDSCKTLGMTGTIFMNDVTEFFRGVNLLQPNKSLHLPTNKRAFRDKYIINGKLSPQFQEDYQKCARGLVSYFDLSNDHKKVAQVTQENQVRVKFNELVTCGYVGTGRMHRGAGGKKEGWAKCHPSNARCIQRHYLFVRWNRQWNIFERNAPNFTRPDSEIRTVLEFIRANLETVAPKILALQSMIKRQDEQDMKTHGKLFKHMVFTGVDVFGIDRGIVPFIAVWMALGYNFIQEIRHGKWAIKDPLPEGNNNFAALYSRGMFTAGGRPLDMKCVEQKEGKSSSSSKRRCIVTDLLDTTCGVFNHHEKNNNGQLIRFILLDQGFSTGIDLYDIKHVHIMEEQQTKATDTQVRGRAARYCGSVGLPQSEPDKSWDIDVTTYFGEFAEAKCLKLKSKGPFEHVKTLGGNVAQANIADEVVNIIIKSAVDHDLVAMFQASSNKKPLVEKYVFENLALAKDNDAPQIRSEPEPQIRPESQIRQPQSESEPPRRPEPRPQSVEEYLEDEWQPHTFTHSLKELGLDG